MAVIYYDVPLVEQGSNPICLPCCMAMVAAEREQHSPDLKKYVNGFDIAKSSIDLGVASELNNAIKRMARLNFQCCTIDSTRDAIAQFLTTFGPFILIHNCRGFNYGRGHAAEDDGAHAVVVNSIDPQTSLCSINNPWGDKDVIIAVSNVINAIVEFRSIGPNIGYYVK